MGASNSPEGGKPDFRWKAARAARVWEPWTPSIEPEEMPWRARAICTSNVSRGGRGKPVAMETGRGGAGALVLAVLVLVNLGDGSGTGAGGRLRLVLVRGGDGAE